jgi:hypothetical protein
LDKHLVDFGTHFDFDLGFDLDKQLDSDKHLVDFGTHFDFDLGFDSHSCWDFAYEEHWGLVEHLHFCLLHCFPAFFLKD